MKNKLLFDSIDVRGKSFLDIGCFNGDTCEEAVRRGASSVVGVDYVINTALVQKARGAFDIWQMDIFSEKWLHLPEFDVVSCQGVFYHVPDPISLFNRLRLVTKGTLFLEGEAISSGSCVMKFCRDDELNHNHSNWWTPSISCLKAMLTAAGFTDIKMLDQRMPRVALTARPSACDLRKTMPRNMRYMRFDGGSGSK